MTIRKYLYAAAIAAAVSTISIFGWASSTSAKGKAVAGPDPFPCWNDAPVCGSRSGHRFTYANACSARRDGAKVVSHRACSAKKAHRPHRARRHHRAKKAVTKPAMPVVSKPATMPSEMKPAPKSATAPAPAQKMDMKPAPAASPPAEKTEAKPAAPAAATETPAPAPASQPPAPQNTEMKTDTKPDK